MNNFVIITSFFDTDINLKDEINSDDYVICLDGGYDKAIEQNISVDLLLGDFDSIKNIPSNDVKIMKFPPEKDYTDLELSLKYASSLNADNVIILGGIGGRLDHTIANIQMMSLYSSKFASLVMKDNANMCFILDSTCMKECKIPCMPDTYISIFSLSEVTSGINFEGVKYTLNNHTLTRTYPLGVSNEFKEKEATLSIKDGTLLVIISKKL